MLKAKILTQSDEITPIERVRNKTAPKKRNNWLKKRQETNTEDKTTWNYDNWLQQL
jgi:hypothetical protein